jgi:hypothetical protein
VTIELNHTIVPARDAFASASFLAEMLARDPPVRFGPFWAVALDNGVTLVLRSRAAGAGYSCVGRICPRISPAGNVCA